MSTTGPDKSEPPPKRSRLEDVAEEKAELTSNDDTCSVLDNVVDSRVLSNVGQYLETYQDAKPYRHGLIEGICVDGFLENVLDEIKQNSKVKFKESDLFRVYQSIDMANLSGDSVDAEKMPYIMKLRSALYSSEFRSFVEKISDLESGTLTEQVDCAANCHAPGCHLLCHDDVIGTRKVSYILYLTDPLPLWTKEEGGQLELYDSIIEDETDGARKRMVPKAFPCKTIIPTFNNMAYFVVKPGESFHSVQEVFGDRPRLSLQGWYHAKSAPSQMEDATLSRLKTTGKEEDTDGAYTEMEHEMTKEDQASTGDLSEADREYLAQYINGIYLSDSSLKEICARFEDESSVQLRHFLVDKWATQIKAATTQCDERDRLGKGAGALDYAVGVDSEWKATGPAHKQRFLEYTGTDLSKAQSAGATLQNIKCSVFESPQFGRFLKKLTSLGAPLAYRGRVRRFRPGLDYTVAHYGILTRKPVLDATLCFAAGSGNQCIYDESTGDQEGFDTDAVWDSGDVGGFECYIAADDEDEEEHDADDEYDDEDDTELLSVSASDNTLSLVYRNEGTMRF
eukprot:CAMPEP_0198298068 /NCGR_PEP_ID=MMETSP1449-20131203/39555_1 /TAXON_ID=420275 /ORGANISM="Attheya septentrionalis, Strain CCMP2084" /LENGTH=566 /DNA_ID=CAMNT_0043999241 /DNA_START=149 /DNA_END=1846 /DNA_ORIENTATION=-